ncbi:MULTISPECIES: DMT family transporter [unclassified Luteimonas]|uniref:DMT family transporter n=1 Tax=unclassified Luteimonas TaxID=2629088 RepID=UPI00160497A3|nr:MULTISPECIES: DMT family transporter [unclassified Luteimonas]MBB1473125.1 DMT family transporter [Luteimonas sp. MC1782]MBB6598171.1 DMT family transporter [Luteimonas sp. MC1825]QOC88397.1 DMT family transporter [Luteimonas sp. MC1825]
MNTWLAMLAIVLVGAILPLQGLINARLSVALHGVVATAFVSFLVGVVLLAAWLLVTRTPLGPVPGARFPPWIWLGGILGAIYVVVFTLLIGRVGAAAAICLAVLGQVLASLALDHFGVLQAARPADWTRIAGATLVLAGVLLVAAPWRAPA